MTAEKEVTDTAVLREWLDRHNRTPLFITRLRARLTDEQINHVLSVLDDICQECWDADSGCQCWNDE